MRHLLWPVLLLLSGCALFTAPEEQKDSASLINIQKAEHTPKTYPTKPFETDTLYNLLVAEIAGQRSQYDLALSYYLSEAKHTQDPYVAARASRIAQYLDEPEIAAEAADIWRKSDKANIHAHLASAHNWLQQHKAQKAVTALTDAMSISSSISLEQIYLLGKTLPTKEQTVLTDGIKELILSHPNHTRLYFTLALLLNDFGHTEDALKTMRTLSEKGEMSPPHYIMLAKLYARTNQPDASIQTLEEGWDAFTGDKTLGLLYAQAYADRKQKDEALEILNLLTEIHPADDEVLISGALIHIELNNLKEAERLLLITTETKQKDSAWHFLGQLYEQQDLPQKAVEAFLQVKKGKNFLPAISRASNLKAKLEGIKAAQVTLRELHNEHPLSIPRLIQIEAELLRENGNNETALELYNEALILEPQDQNLLYGRAMVLDLTNDIEGMERDLKAILARNPQSATALNALGYTLADKTDRLEEAKDYIYQAYQLRPKDPAIIDSLGWIYYRLGDYAKAEVLLAQAYSLFQDQEVAAHLGEVLWVQNKKEQALKIWIDGLKRSPNSEKLRETMKRFNINVNIEKEAPKEQSPTEDSPQN